jgi:hypothetical protein
MLDLKFATDFKLDCPTFAPHTLVLLKYGGLMWRRVETAVARNPYASEPDLYSDCNYM